MSELITVIERLDKDGTCWRKIGDGPWELQPNWYREQPFILFELDGSKPKSEDGK